ncbi:DUF488 domain-containing protein [Streptomyces sp. PBH53]|uniref:DUF488 domain-containing protein n=1 Tax=Streptomyces sp. PBH53 TaxID=1577075 RepID=UPI000A894BCA|nr:DUF488 domain-containing protein [Streptomyces sp. PBH53]
MALLDSRIGVVADVRLTPAGRKKGFGKARLGQVLAEVGIAYTQLRGLSDPRTTKSRCGAVASMWAGRAAWQARVAVLCFERNERAAATGRSSWRRCASGPPCP